MRASIGLFARWPRFEPRRQRRAAAALRARHAARAGHHTHCLHAFDEGFVAEVDLLAQALLPQRHVARRGHQVGIGCLSATPLCGRAHVSAQHLRVHRGRVKPHRCTHIADVSAIARPWPLARALHHLRAHRVQLDVAARFEQIALCVDEDGLEAALEHMPRLVVATVESLRVHAVDLAHQR